MAPGFRTALHLSGTEPPSPSPAPDSSLSSFSPAGTDPEGCGRHRPGQCLWPLYWPVGQVRGQLPASQMLQGDIFGAGRRDSSFRGCCTLDLQAGRGSRAACGGRALAAGLHGRQPTRPRPDAQPGPSRSRWKAGSGPRSGKALVWALPRPSVWSQVNLGGPRGSLLLWLRGSQRGLAFLPLLFLS